MIDTIRFQIKINLKIYEELRAKSTETLRTNHVNNQLVFQYFSTFFDIGSFSRTVSVFVPDEDVCYLEFSVPKQFGGDNVRLLPLSEVFGAIELVYKAIAKEVPSFPHLSTWTVHRLDLCYAWKLENQDAAEKCLEAIRHFIKPAHFHMGQGLYKESVIFKGSTYTQKFYLKEPEFIKHDFKALLTLDQNRAYELLQLSAGVLRYEITLRQQVLDYLFGIDLSLGRLLKEDIMFIHKLYFDKLFNKLEKTTMSSEAIFEKLKKSYGSAKAMRLYQFYKVYYSPDSFDRAVTVKSLDRSTVWRNLRDIKSAGVGILSKEIFQLRIPSPESEESLSMP